MAFPRASLYTVIAVILLHPAGVKAQDRPTDPWLTNPVDDATFATYLEFSAYDKDLPFDLIVTS